MIIKKTARTHLPTYISACTNTQTNTRAFSHKVTMHERLGACGCSQESPWCGRSFSSALQPFGSMLGKYPMKKDEDRWKKFANKATSHCPFACQTTHGRAGSYSLYRFCLPGSRWGSACFTHATGCKWCDCNCRQLGTCWCDECIWSMTCKPRWKFKIVD